MFASHTRVTGNNRNIHTFRVLIPSSYHIIPHHKRQFLFKAKSILDHSDITTGKIGFLHFFFLSGLRTHSLSTQFYLKLGTTLRTYKSQDFPIGILCFIE